MRRRIALLLVVPLLSIPGVLSALEIFSDGFETGTIDAWSDSTIPPWLVYMNRFRSLAGLPWPAEQTSWSNGCWLHSRYCVKNDVITHYETSGNPWYTTEGAAAGQSGNVAVSSSVSASDEFFLDLWMTGPFHAVGIIDPQLEESAYGSYREAIGSWRSAATLDVLRGLGAVPAGVTFPVYFPKPGGQTWLRSYGGNEAPNPLTHTTCSVFGSSSGSPVILQLGSGGVTPNVTAHSFLDNGSSAQHCVFDETDYYNPNPDYQSLGRNVLGARDAVVLMPRYALVVGHTYTVSITSGGQVYSWSFTAVSSPSRSQEPTVWEVLEMDTPPAIAVSDHQPQP